MGIFDRFNRVLKSNLNSLVDRAEDPAKLLDQTVLDMENELKRAKKELVTQLGTAKRLEKKVAEHGDEVKSWEDKAVLALRSGDEQLAREALKMKQKAKSTQDNVQKQADAAFGSARDLQSTLEQIEAKIEDLKARKTTLAAQVRRARESSSAGGAGGGRFGAETLDGLDQLSGRIDQLEAEVEASNLLDDPERAAVERRFRDLEKKSGGAAVEDDLAALKRKLEGS
ncbi:PspA/IM30 family protein [Sandaracinus amylolyticus]|uniref:Phage shock protein A n=1 Tax=Sandaracinus amylolyticus TaxID=927083 RepID=A0A0F6W5I2_9BACT|nr:PspA/IM30 family protein [Sandaracinus amylolyticus]AKF07923.1 Phage shock protein A [Sandaracinus amylolyticus]